MLRTAIVAGLAASALTAPVLTTPAVAGSQFTVVSQSVIALKGLPSRKKKRVVVVSPVVKASVDNGRMMSAEERRLLRYGVAEESRDIAANAAREVDEEDAADTMGEAEAETPVEEAEDVATGEAEAEEKEEVSTTVSVDEPAAKPKPAVAWESTASQSADSEAVARSRERQNKAEAPELPDSRIDELERARDDAVRARKEAAEAAKGDPDLGING